MSQNTTTEKKVTFLNEWSAWQFRDVEKAITKFINSRYWETHHSPDASPFIIKQATRFNQIADILGLAYTSSSSFAGYWACNTQLFLDNDHKFSLDGFALDTNSFVHAIFFR